MNAQSQSGVSGSNSTVSTGSGSPRTGSTGAFSSSAARHLVAFEYLASPALAAAPVWEGWADAPDDCTASPAANLPDAALRAEFEGKLAEETRRSFEVGRVQGRQEGHHTEREAASAAGAAADNERRCQAVALLDNLARERDRFLQSVEREVVQLSLAVAARILRREAQMDPLLLTGAVRVALGQLASTTTARMRVPPAELELWTEAMALVPNLALKPTVVPGDGMRLGDCLIETELGSVDLGIRAQLGEIERGFFDRAGGHAPQSLEAAAMSAHRS